MYRQEIKHKTKFELINNQPKISIGIKFKDFFTEDTYMFISENNKNFDKKNIFFDFSINNKNIKKCRLENLNFENFFNNEFDEIDDFDFKNLFTNEIIKKISSDVLENIKSYEKEILLYEVSYEGEFLRMKQLSGLKKK